MPNNLEDAFNLSLAQKSRSELDLPLQSLCPRINKNCGELQLKCLDRCVQFKLIPDSEKARQRMLSFNLERLSARFFPNATKEQMEIGADFMYFFFVYDDICDNQDCTDPAVEDRIRKIENRLFFVLAGGMKSEEGEEAPLAAMMHFILKRCESFAHPGWHELFRLSVKKYIEGVRWERKVRSAGEALTLPKYEKIRAASVGSIPIVYMSAMFHCREAPDVIESCYVEELLRTAAFLVAWVNDIFTVWKDVRDSTDDNIVLVLVNKWQLSWTEALKLAVGLVKDEMENLMSLESNLEDMIGSMSGGVEAIVEGVHCVVRGNYDWSMETSRYRDVGASPRGAEKETK